MIRLHNVSKKFRRRGDFVLREVSTTITARSRTLILGRRGAGKTTLLRLMCGLDLPTSGSIERRMSVSFPIGSNVRYPKRYTLRQYIDFIAGIHTVDSKSLAFFLTQTGRLDPNLERSMSAIAGVQRRRLNFLIGYALPFDCYLFDEIIGPRSESDGDLFQELLERRGEHASLVLTTKAIKNAREFAVADTAIYILHDGALTPYETIDEAVEVFRLLPDRSEPSPTFDEMPDPS